MADELPVILSRGTFVQSIHVKSVRQVALIRFLQLVQVLKLLAK